MGVIDNIESKLIDEVWSAAAPYVVVYTIAVILVSVLLSKWWICEDGNRRRHGSHKGRRGSGKGRSGSGKGRKKKGSKGSKSSSRHGSDGGSQRSGQSK